MLYVFMYYVCILYMNAVLEFLWLVRALRVYVCRIARRAAKHKQVNTRVYRNTASQTRCTATYTAYVHM